MKRFLVLLLVIFFFVTCKKQRAEILDGYISGKLVYEEPTDSTTDLLPLASKKVKISGLPGDGVNYTRSTLTDNGGYFLFETLHKDSSYYVFFNDTINNIQYTGSATSPAYSDKVQITVRPDFSKQNALKVSVTSYGDGIAHAKVCVFNNATAWNTNDCGNSLLTLTMGQNGSLVKYNVAPGNYYFLTNVTIGDTTYQAKSTVTVNPTGLAPTTLVLRPVVTATGFEVQVTDPYGSPLNGAQVCVFSSYTLFQAGDCSGSVLQPLLTDIQGKARVTTLPEGQYYLRVSIKVGNATLTGIGSVKVEKGKVNSIQVPVT
jgi:hypothetical protein